MRSRLAIYRIDWKGIQQLVYLPCTFNIVANAGAAESKGAEFELDMAVVDHLTLNLAAGYEKAEISEGSVTSRTYAGQPLTGVPKWSGSVTAQYVIPMGGERSAFLRGQWEYTGARTSFNNGFLPLEAFNLLNLRGGVKQGRWETTLFVQNVFDKRGVLGDLIPEGAQLEGRPKLFVTRPRTVGLQIKRDF